MSKPGWHLFCPLMKEVCNDGHTKTMGHDEEDHAISCALWQERMVVNPDTKQIEPARACYFHHATVLSLNKIQATTQGTASVDEVRKELQIIRGMGAPAPVEAEPEQLEQGNENGRPRLS